MTTLIVLSSFFAIFFGLNYGLYYLAEKKRKKENSQATG